MESYADYLRLRFEADAHVWASVLFEEVTDLGYDRSYQSFTRHLRELGLRPHCESCDGVKGRATVEVFGDSEQLMALPAAPFPSMIEVERKVGQSGLVSFEGNSYSVPPGLIGALVTCTHRLGSDTLKITSAAGVQVASHRLRPAGPGAMIRTPEHSTDFQAVILGQ